MAIPASSKQPGLLPTSEESIKASSRTIYLLIYFSEPTHTLSCCPVIRPPMSQLKKHLPEEVFGGLGRTDVTQKVPWTYTDSRTPGPDYAEQGAMGALCSQVLAQGTAKHLTWAEVPHWGSKPVRLTALYCAAEHGAITQITPASAHGHTGLRNTVDDNGRAMKIKNEHAKLNSRPVESLKQATKNMLMAIRGLSLGHLWVQATAQCSLGTVPISSWGHS